DDAPKPKRGPRTADAILKAASHADPNDLPKQRWGVIAPSGSDGDKLIEAIAPLIRLREAEQGAPAKIYRVEPGMDANASVRFRDDIYHPEGAPEEERARYLLVLGDLHQVSIELQHVLANGSFVGRIHFANPAGDADHAGYAAYADKVVSWAQKATKPDTM